MTRGERCFVLDSNLFIRSFRDPDVNRELDEFHLLFAPFEYTCSVVVQELRAGARSPRDRRRLERNVLRSYERRDRIITPSPQAWSLSGDLLAAMSRRGDVDLPRASKAFANDLLLALSCREQGMVLVTENTEDFRRIRRYVRFEFIAPWPKPIT